MTIQNDFIEAFNAVASDVHSTAKEKGWWESDRNDGELLMLVVSELAEGLEALRKDLQSDHIPDFLGIEEELADVIIRIMDAASCRNWKVAEALISKIEFNKTREYKHGWKKF